MQRGLYSAKRYACMTPPSNHPSKNPCSYWSPYKAPRTSLKEPSKNPFKNPLHNPLHDPLVRALARCGSGERGGILVWDLSSLMRWQMTNLTSTPCRTICLDHAPSFEQFQESSLRNNFGRKVLQSDHWSTTGNARYLKNSFDHLGLFMMALWPSEHSPESIAKCHTV